MNLPKNLGIILLGIWLILFGILNAPFLGISFAYGREVLAILAIVAGAVLLWKRG